MVNNYIDVVSSSTTDELKDIYLYRFLDYNEEFVKCCYNELIQNRGISSDELKSDIERISAQSTYNIVRYMKSNGRTEREIRKALNHYGIVDCDDVLEIIKDEEKEEKEKQINNQIIGGIGLLIFVLIVYYIGYEFTLFNSVPISELLMVIGGGLTIIGIIRKLLINFYT